MTGDTRPDIPAVKVCEHFYASHCYRGMSIRLCMLCHEPDWDDLAGQLDGARGSVVSTSVPAVTSPAPAPAEPPAASTGPSAPVSEAAVQAALDAVPKFWREAHAILQAYPSAALARAMLEGAAPLMRGRAEAQVAEIESLCRGIKASVVHDATPIVAVDRILAITEAGEEPS